MVKPHFPLPTDAVDSFADAVIVTDRVGRITFWNAGAERVFGWTAAEALGETPAALLAPADQADWETLLMTALETGEYHADHQALTRVGDAVWLNVKVTPLPEDGDQALQLLLVARDVTQRRRREAERQQMLAEHQQQNSTLQALLHSMAEGVFLVDQASNVSLCNAAMETLLEVRPTEVVGRPYSMLFGEFLPLAEEPQAVRFDLERAVKQIRELPVVYLTLHQPLTRLLQIKLFPVTNEDGESLGWGGLVRDLTRADETNVLATISHELRAPLAAIKGYVTTLLDNYQRWESAAVEEFLETVDASVDQLSGLVENMLDMSRLETGILELKRRGLDLPALAVRAVEQIRLRTRRHQFVVQFPEDFPQPRADQVRIEQVLRNLLQNAVKYSPEGGVITVSGAATERDITVRVADEGSGVPPGEQERIFDRFYQANGDQATAAGGAGLGLYICRRIVETHGGHIWAESAAPGAGSVFAFQLPLAPQPETPVTPAQQRAQPPARVRSPADVCVLVVEDDARLLRFIKANLESSGYEVLTALDGQEALTAIERELPDLVLLDIMLPKLDGYEVCARVREFTQVPIIMLTGRTGEADQVRGFDLGADDYLTKPFGTEELLARVRAVLRRSRFPEEVQSQPVLVSGPLTIDFAQRKVTVAGQEVSLTPTEYKLLYHLAMNAGQVLTHEQLLHEVWGTEYETESAYLWVYVSRLRKKIERDPDEPRYIQTETGIGYRFAA